MIIPKGKKFRFKSQEFDSNNGRATTKKTPKVFRYLSPTLQKKVGKNYDLNNCIITPPYGYMGQAYISQDINLSLTANYTKPLEGMLGKIPHAVDLIYEGLTGTSLNNSKFTNMKYWSGTESPEISIQVEFKTMIDSYYDVYRPIVNLMRLVLPYETEYGFYKPPTLFTKEIAQQAAKYIPIASTNLAEYITKKSDSKALKDKKTGVIKKSRTLKGTLDKIAHKSKKTGFETNLYIGNNFKFSKILIKSVNPTFSSELAYAPIHFLNGKKDIEYDQGAWFNPYTMGPFVTKTFSQAIGGILALGNKATQMYKNVLSSLPKILQDRLSANIGDMPAFPLSATVNITFELQYPFVRNVDKGYKERNSILNTFPSSGFNDLDDLIKE